MNNQHMEEVMKQNKQGGSFGAVTRLSIAATVMFAGLSLPAAAEWYGVVNIGESELDEEICQGVPGCSEDLKDTGWKLAIGNQFNANAAIEFGYVDLGEAKASASGPGGSLTCQADASGFNAGIVGGLPVSKEFSFTGRIGLFRWDSDGSCSGVVNLSGSDSGTDLTFGVGVRYDFTQSVGLRGEWERFDVDDSDIDLLSLGLIFMFK
jgi:OOP family OmpA-OmpF porin